MCVCVGVCSRRTHAPPSSNTHSHKHEHHTANARVTGPFSSSTPALIADKFSGETTGLRLGSDAFSSARSPPVAGAGAALPLPLASVAGRGVAAPVKGLSEKSEPPTALRFILMWSRALRAAGIGSGSFVPAASFPSAPPAPGRPSGGGEERACDTRRGDGAADSSARPRGEMTAAEYLGSWLSDGVSSVSSDRSPCCGASRCCVWRQTRMSDPTRAHLQAGRARTRAHISSLAHCDLRSNERASAHRTHPLCNVDANALRFKRRTAACRCCPVLAAPAVVGRDRRRVPRRFPGHRRAAPTAIRVRGDPVDVRLLCLAA